MIPKEASKIIRDIKSIKVQGARNVAKAGLRALMKTAEKSKAKTESEFYKELKDASKKILSARPTEPELWHSIKFVVYTVENSKDKDAEKLKKLTNKLCRDGIKDVNDTVKKIAKYGERQIANGDVILTHCHSSTVVEVLKAAKRKRKKFEVIVTETRPLYQGIKTAKELIKAKIPVTYVVDSAAGAYMHKATKCLFGADAILNDGGVVNKIGTFLMALAAEAYHVPVLIAAGSHKFDSRTLLGFPEPIEMRDRREIISPGKLRRAKIENPAFDITPAHYIREIITERGVFNPVALVALVSKEEQYYAAE